MTLDVHWSRNDSRVVSLYYYSPIKPPIDLHGAAADGYAVAAHHGVTGCIWQEGNTITRGLVALSLPRGDGPGTWRRLIWMPPCLVGTLLHQ